MKTSTSLAGKKPVTQKQLRFFSYVLPCVVLGLALGMAWYFWERERR